MSKTGAERIYPAAPLEEVVTHEQQQQLLPPSPPTYDQATGVAAAAPAPAAATTATPVTARSATHVVVITPPPTVPLGPVPADIQCPYCHNFTHTRLRHTPTSKTHLIALLLCLFQLYCCICLPYCIASCMSTSHYCGMCDKYLGTYDRT